MDLQQYVSSCHRAWYVLSIKEESWGLPWCPVLSLFAPNIGDTGQGTTWHVMEPKKKKGVMGGLGAFGNASGQVGF